MHLIVRNRISLSFYQVLFLIPWFRSLVLGSPSLIVAIVPVDTDDDPDDTKGYQILSMRVGRIRDWYPRHVRVEVYNENTGRKQEIVVPKATVAIVENPLYAVINEPNSTMQRLIRKLNLLKTVQEVKHGV